MAKLILFDIDGTLLQTGGIGQDSAGVSLQRVFGTSGRVEEFYPSGRTIEAIFRDTLLDAGISLEDYEKKREILYLDFFAEFTEQASRREADLVPLPGARELLDVLEDNPGLVLGLVTGNHSFTAEKKLEGAGIDFSRFLVGAYGNEAAHRPDLIPLAKERASKLTGQNFSGERTIVIGDTVRDVETAKENNATSIAVASGKSSLEELGEASPDLLLPDLRDTEAVVKAILDQ